MEITERQIRRIARQEFEQMLRGNNYTRSGGSGGGAMAMYELNDVARDGNKVLGAAEGKLLRYGSDAKWFADTLAFSALKGKATASQVPNIEELTNFSTKVYDASATRSANTVLAGPISGSATAATFRSLVAADIPTLAISKISGLQTALDGKLDIAFFSRLFQAKNGNANVNPNDTTTNIDSIEAMFGFWTEQYISALGQGSGGGSTMALVDLVDVAISNPTNGQVLKYNSTTGKWYNGTDQGVTSLDWANITNKPDTATRWPAFSEVTSKPTTLSGYGITDAKIANGTITLGSNTITPLTSVAFSDLTTHPTTLSGYGITDAKIANGTITLGSNTITPLTSVAFSDLTTHPTTLSGYGITDAKIQSGTITLGSNTITPLTSVAFSDLTSHPTTLSGYGITDAKIASGTITLGTNTITPLTSSSSIGFSQLPTMYWANVQVSNQSNDATEPKMKSLHLYGSSTYGVGGLLKFGDGSDDGYVYLKEAIDDKLTIYGKSGIYMMGGTSFKVGIGTTSPAKVLDVVGDINATLDITTAQAVNARNIELSFTSPFIDFHHASSSADYTSRLITTDYGTLNLQSKTSGGTDKLSGFVVGANYDGSFIQIGNIKILYDSSNNALKIIKSDGTAANFYATGGVSALGQSSGSSSAYYANLAVGTQLNVNGRAYFNDDIYVNVGGYDYVLDGNRCVELGILS